MENVKVTSVMKPDGSEIFMVEIDAGDLTPEQIADHVKRVAAHLREQKLVPPTAEIVFAPH